MVRRMITEKIDRYLNEFAHRSKEIYPGKVDLKAIGYKDTNAKCCGTCNYYEGELCKNPENIETILDGQKAPPGIGILVDGSGICPRFEPDYSGV